MRITFIEKVALAVYASLIGPVMDVQPSRDEGPKIEKRQPLKKEQPKKDLLPNPQFKKIK